MLNFAKAEYQTRLKKTKQSMEKQGINVLLITDPANISYLTGFNAWSFYVHQLLIVIDQEEEPIWAGRRIDASAAQITTWLSNENILPYSDDHVQSTRKHPMDFVAGILKEKGQSNKTIAAEFDAYYFTARNYIQLTQQLPDATFVDGTTLVNWIRIIKSEQEIEYIKRAATIVTETMYKGIDRIQAGVRECDVVADIFHKQISGTEEFGGDYTSIVPLLPSGEKTSACHLTWTDEVYKEGDPVILELAGCHKRYHSPLARTLVIGKPTSEMEELADVTIEGIEAALDIIKPGVTCEEVELAWKRSIEKRGFEKESRLGYSTGLNYPPDWGEHTASLRSGDQTVLQPNMVFHMIPGIWMDTYGIEISETFRVTESGVEVLANVDRKLFIK
ncbi:M24 family metallopeptidase [Oceanobacillus jeddahense]|uniref:M24 family metallopeptidase n=1 Tax=Oceanobacillus jeddahense TaxID=1462527 RepID=A0ABY5JS24_9BACI|nr:M24 family metallopeptidase [Oceanobacillus jeddahense]UUI01871.1 M24 family metallopeptidase [Oceanobacillus jeddahense]